MNFQDKTLTCRDCGQDFVFTASEQQFYQEKGFANAPTRCPDCRKKNKMQKMQDRGSYSSGPREMHEAVCSNCGNKCMVPFKPRGDRPVLCNDCYRQQHSQRRAA